MGAEIVSQQRLAERLGITPRRLRDLEGAGVVIAVGRGRYDAADALRRYAVFKGRDPERIAAMADEAGDLLAAARRAIARLDPENWEPVEARRIGATVERADGLLRLLGAMRPEHERPMADHMRREIVGALVGEMLGRLGERRAYERRPGVDAAHALGGGNAG